MPPSIEPSGDLAGLGNSHIARQPGIERADEGLGHVPHRCVEGGHLPYCVHTGVGAPSPLQPNRPTEQAGEGGLNLALHRKGVRLDLEAMEPAAVVLQPQRNPAQRRLCYSAPTNSSCTNGAASPLRKPSFTIRVYPPGRSL